MHKMHLININLSLNIIKELFISIKVITVLSQITIQEL